MPKEMRVSIAPAGTRTGTAVIRSLLSMTEPVVEVRGLYRDLARVPAEFTFQRRFHAVRADVSDPSTLDFAGSDAVLAITPPVYDGRDLLQHAEKASESVKKAIETSGSVKRLVLLSSVGAQYSTGVVRLPTVASPLQYTQTDVLPGRNQDEQRGGEGIFDDGHPIHDICSLRVLMENWTESLETLKAPQPFFFSTITPLDLGVPMVAVDDIGSTLAAELVHEAVAPVKPRIFELHGPRLYTPLDVRAAFCKALGREVEMKPVVPSELDHFFSQIFPRQIVGDRVEMAKSFLPGGIMAADTMTYDDVDVVRGSIELDTALSSAVGRGLFES